MNCLCKLLSVLLCLSAISSFGDVVNLYFAGGQSNAKAEWAAAIEARLGAFIDNVEVVHIRHSGNPMSQWYTTSAQANYDADFFNTSATGKLETAIADIEAAGDEAVFSRFFLVSGRD